MGKQATKQISACVYVYVRVTKVRQCRCLRQSVATERGTPLTFQATFVAVLSWVFAGLICCASCLCQWRVVMSVIPIPIPDYVVVEAKVVAIVVSLRQRPRSEQQQSPWLLEVAAKPGTTEFENREIQVGMSV